MQSCIFTNAKLQMESILAVLFPAFYTYQFSITIDQDYFTSNVNLFETRAMLISSYFSTIYMLHLFISISGVYNSSE